MVFVEIIRIDYLIQKIKSKFWVTVNILNKFHSCNLI